MLESLKPTKHLLVYDLVRESGIDVSDWSNYKQPELPQSNPRYCYEWAFSGKDRVVLCLWYEDMREEGSSIFQNINVNEVAKSESEKNSLRKRRSNSLKNVVSAAWKNQLPVRVIIVHDPNPTNDSREVNLRTLDPEPWHVADYNETSGECTLERGSGSSGHRVSILQFLAELSNLKSHLHAHDGYPFTSFTRGKIYEWENYKDYVFAEANRRLNWRKWQAHEVGTGAIMDRVIHAVEIDDGPQKRNNLLKWQQYGVHKILEEKRNSTDCFQLESLLFDFYTGELEAANVFDPLVEILGKKYPLIAYLFFIKDCSQFLPISPENFDALFDRLGVRLKTAGHCGWKNYSAYLKVIHEIRDLLETEGFEGVRLLEAHSFCWLLCSIDKPKETKIKIAPIKELRTEPSTSGDPIARAIDWEALQRARNALGRLGEDIACKAEQERLIREGRPDLAQNVRLVSADHKAGYDLHSYEVDGQDRFIEVKTISDDCSGFRFYTSFRQLEFAHASHNHYYYLVKGARTESPQIHSIRAENIPADAMRAIVHEVILQEI